MSGARGVAVWVRGGDGWVSVDRRLFHQGSSNILDDPRFHVVASER